MLYLLESQNLEDSSRQEDKKYLESPEQNLSQDPYKITEENKKDENNKESIEDKLSFEVGEFFLKPKTKIFQLFLIFFNNRGKV